MKFSTFVKYFNDGNYFVKDNILYMAIGCPPGSSYEDRTYLKEGQVIEITDNLIIYEKSTTEQIIIDNCEVGSKEWKEKQNGKVQDNETN